MIATRPRTRWASLSPTSASVRSLPSAVGTIRDASQTWARAAAHLVERRRAGPRRAAAGRGRAPSRSGSGPPTRRAARSRRGYRRSAWCIQIQYGRRGQSAGAHPKYDPDWRRGKGISRKQARRCADPSGAPAAQVPVRVGLPRHDGARSSGDRVPRPGSIDRAAGAVCGRWLGSSGRCRSGSWPACRMLPRM